MSEVAAGEVPDPQPLRRRFFPDGEQSSPDEQSRPAESAPFNAPRSMVAGATIIDLRKRGGGQKIQSTQAWQESAWQYYDQVGEVKFAFNLFAQVVSRALLYAALIEDSSEVPVEAQAFLKSLEERASGAAHSTKVAEAARLADEALRELTSESQSELLRQFSLNLSVPGECYLVHDVAMEKWIVASISELKGGDPPQLQLRRENNQGGATNLGGGRTLPRTAYVARIWRSHPRWSAEADSSMLGALDQLEKVVLFDQVMRTISRSRLGAGVIFIPTGLSPANGMSLAEALTEVTVKPVEDEAIETTVTPLLLTGPPELGEKIKRIDLARPIDDQMLALSQDAMDRSLASLDIPKSIVSGMADTRYANALVIDDSLYKAHIEPMILAICDALTTVYLRPKLRKAGVDEEIIDRLVVWYNPAQIVTRPDRSQAANEGYDRYLLSGTAWRRARGYSDLDQPDESELLQRLALEKVQIPQDLGDTLVKALAPEFFKQASAAGAAEAGVPPELTDLLDGAPAAAPEEAPNAESPMRTDEASGGELSQGGSQPPRPGVQQRGPA